MMDVLFYHRFALLLNYFEVFQVKIIDFIHRLIETYKLLCPDRMVTFQKPNFRWLGGTSNLLCVHGSWLIELAFGGTTRFIRCPTKRGIRHRSTFSMPLLRCNSALLTIFSQLDDKRHRKRSSPLYTRTMNRITFRRGHAINQADRLFFA